ncbi:hypothetical protein J0673_04595 [Vibrio sp. Vb2736]|uniref:hypothetical protein n=1 Tax=Vibrio sp. Vb2736 TaxID=2816075 RepID=UPI001A8D9E63|nr:hypothetical protein [Vibrio sp. Vb2736]MBO0135567.1 hypothetical protein [Vibrio sp. Vb2736]
MTKNIEQRTLAATTTMEVAAKSVDEIAHQDKDVQTPAGMRKSFPKIAREADEGFYNQRQTHEQDFQNRWSISQQAIGWQPLTLVSDSLQRYSVGTVGEEGYKEYLPAPEQLPFTTRATIAEDLAEGRWLENGVPSKDLVNTIAGKVSDSILGGLTWPPQPDKSAKVGDIVSAGTEFLRVQYSIYPIAGIASGELTELNLIAKPYHATIGGTKYWLLNQRYFDRFAIDIRAFWPAADKVTDDSEPWLRALEYCTENNILLRGDGEYAVSQPLEGTCPMALHRCVLHYPEGFLGIAFTVGMDGNDERNTNSEFKTPKILIKKSNAGWLVENIGMYLKNLYTSDVFVPQVEHFKHGVRCEGVNTGNVYNRYYLGRVINNQVNLELWQGPGTGWCNENNFIGGRLAYYSAEPAGQVGTKQIHLRAEPTETNPNNGPNNNRFFGISVEGHIHEVTVEIDESCSYNMFQGLRYEGDGHKIVINGDRNCFFYGFGLSFVDVEDNGNRNDVFNDQYRMFNGSDTEACLRVRNSYSDNASAMSVYNIAGTRVIDLKGNGSVGVKNEGAEYDRYRLSSYGLLSGDGTAEPEYFLRDWVQYMRFMKPLKVESGFSLFERAPVEVKPVVNGATGGNEALDNLLSVLSSYGLIDNQTTTP